MDKKQNQNASFMVRFNQRIYQENGDDKVQWRGKISHVQDGDEKRFSDFNDALVFMQQKLSELTEKATTDKTSEEQENIVKKSLSMWKTIKAVGPQVIKETLKDPKKQFENLQGEIQEKITVLGDEISEKVQIDQWRNASRSDFHEIQNEISSLSKEIKKLAKKIDGLQK
ncbi:MAG: hypothetical protein CMB99_06730 [Flavobacteriaceae bacterium]|nr:hypothetical protein [Flavobacteriaceae bacterium]|tara:strand:+ start:88625 stop:89134 length:510 start_codon:yes stop_codon:yes gene_type:complete